MLHVLLIAVFAVLFVREDMGSAWLQLGDRRVASFTLGSMAVVWLVSHAMIWMLGRRLDRRGDLRTVAMADTVSAAARFVAILLHAFCVLGLGWLDVVRQRVGNLVLVDEILAAAPVLAVVAGTWWSMYGIDRRLREAMLIRDLDDGRPIHMMPSRASYVLGALRHQAALVLVPVMAIGAWNELVERGAGRWQLPPWLPMAVQIAGMVLVLTLIPAVLRRIWDTVRLGPGPLRTTLEGMCREHRARLRELLVWRTQGGMVNGAVMGLVGPIRYILLTDALLESLTPVQVEAVMAHELGHVRRRHMLWLGVAALGAIGLANITGDRLVFTFANDWYYTEWVRGLVGILGIVVGLVLFGFVSRRFEWQADAFAAQHLSGYRTSSGAAGAPLITGEAVSAISTALASVAHLNHIPVHRFTWRHGSIADRRRRLESLRGQRADRLHADREAGVLKLLAAVALISAVVLGLVLSADAGATQAAARLLRSPVSCVS